ncbi:RsmE family RNA methyltransferase [Companilactobacillus hulinensis]|uniref:RsmE family RNA methyltransferase n=1 Tax=Companilactobacillus hulinensis TaxID=2486007 RepID=UPI000F76796D|nr:16S rRNA (uracil(1498)-N(3))-methyltransferase [Companilactobacillus hulinensis]
MEQYFVNESIKQGPFVVTDKEIYKHIATVLRHKVGDVIYLVDENSELFESTISKIDVDNKSIQFDTSISNKPSTEMPVDVTVACSLSKKDKVEWITQKSTELGAKKIIFFNSKYSIMHWKANVVEKKMARLQEIAKNAAQQSKRRIIPEVVYLKDISELNKSTEDLKLIAYEESAKEGENSILAQSLNKPHKSVICVFGPEGGIAPDEISNLQNDGFISIGLGPRIMRAETAPMYFLSVLSYNYELNSK